MLTDHGVLLFGSLSLCLFLLHHIQRVNRVWKAFGNLPACSLLVSPATIIDRILPRIPFISGGPEFSWKNAYERQSLPREPISYPTHGLRTGIFARSKSDIVQFRSLFPYCIPQLLLADATATKV